MKKKIKRVAIIFGVLLTIFLCTTKAYAVGEILNTENEFTAQVDEMLQEYDITYTYEDMENLSLKEIISAIGASLMSRIKAPLRLMGTIFIVIIFSSFMKSSGESVLSGNSSVNLYNLVCVLSAVAVISPGLLSAYENSAQAIRHGGGFMLVFIPIYAGIVIASGGIVTAGVYNTLAIAAAELIVQLSDNLFMPLIAMTAALAITGSIFPNSSLDNIGNLIRKFVTWSLTVAVTLFTGFVSLKSALGNSVDGFAAKTTKFVISGFVPVIGSAVSDAYSTVKGSFDIMRCTAGTAGIVATVLIILPPLLEILAFRAVIWTGTAAAGMFSVKPIEKLLKSLDGGLAIAMSLLVCFGVLFIISTGIMMKSFT